MGSDRLLHDCTFSIAWRSLETIKTLLREENWRDFVEEVMLVARQEVERYEERKAREKARLRPVGKGEENPAR